MSDAPAAAPVTENGVPTSTQEKIVEQVPGHKVFIGNLAYTTTEEGLKAFFAPVSADITSCQIIQRGTRSAGYAFIAFSNEAAATKAAESLNKKELDGREVQVELAKSPQEKEKKPRTKKPKSRRADSKAPPGEVTEAEANGEAGAADGAAPLTDEAAKPKKKKKSAKKPKKKAVEGEAIPADGEAVAAVIDEANAEKKPRAKKPKVPRPPRRAPGEDPAGEPSKNMLFVANLGFALDDAGLEALFKEAGVETVSVHVVRRRWGNPRKSKGYGFVDVTDEAGQKKGIAALDGKEVAGRPIAVKVAIDAVVKEAQAAEAAAVADESAAAAPAAEAPEATVVAA